MTLAWTDPPGNPAAAIKLVNNLDLVVTNLDTGDVFFGNDISAGTTFNSPWNTNGPPNLDVVNNIENVFLPPLLGTNYSVTVVGRGVNVNAVTAQTNNAAGNFAPNVVQDYALVISCGDSADLGAITVTPNPVVSNPTGDQQITFVTATNTPLFDQFAGANSPFLGTNTVELGVTNEMVTVGHDEPVAFLRRDKYAGFHKRGLHHLFAGHAGDPAHGRICRFGGGCNAAGGGQLICTVAVGRS